MYGSSTPFPVLGLLPMSVKKFVEIADPVVKVVQVLNEHFVFNDFLPSDTMLQLISSPGSSHIEPLIFWMPFEILHDSKAVYTKQSPFLISVINHSGRRKSKLYMG